MIEAVKSDPGKSHNGNNIIVDTEIMKKLNRIKRFKETGVHLNVDIVTNLSNYLENTPFKELLNDYIVDIDALFRNLLRNLEQPATTDEEWYHFSADSFVEIRYKMRHFHRIMTGAEGKGFLKWLLADTVSI